MTWPELPVYLIAVAVTSIVFIVKEISEECANIEQIRKERQDAAEEEENER